MDSESGGTKKDVLVNQHIMDQLRIRTFAPVCRVALNASARAILRHSVVKSTATRAKGCV